MAHIEKRKNKDGSVSCQIRAYINETGNGKQIVKSMTWRVPAEMRPRAAEKEANRQAIIFENNLKKHYVTMGGGGNKVRSLCL